MFAYHGYVHCELHPNADTDNQNDSWYSAQSDVTKAHNSEQLHDHHGEENHLPRRKGIVKVRIYYVKIYEFFVPLVLI